MVQGEPVEEGAAGALVEAVDCPEVAVVLHVEEPEAALAQSTGWTHLHGEEVEAAQQRIDELDASSPGWRQAMGAQIGTSRRGGPAIDGSGITAQFMANVRHSFDGTIAEQRYKRVPLPSQPPAPTVAPRLPAKPEPFISVAKEPVLMPQDESELIDATVNQMIEETTRRSKEEVEFELEQDERLWRAARLHAEMMTSARLIAVLLLLAVAFALVVLL